MPWHGQPWAYVTSNMGLLGLGICCERDQTRADVALKGSHAWRGAGLFWPQRPGPLMYVQPTRRAGERTPIMATPSEIGSEYI